MTPHRYTIRELNFIREHYPTKGAKWCAEQLGLNNRKALAQYARKQGIRYEGPTISGFVKGQTPWNKGKRHQPNGSRATQFKPGQDPHNARPYAEPYLRDDHGTKYWYIRPKNGSVMPYHRYLWEMEYGPIPDGHVVAFRDGDPMNCELDNLECLTRSENIRRLHKRKDIDRSAAGKRAWKTRDRNMRKRLGLPVVKNQ